MLASTRRRALRTGSIADLPVEVVLRIWRFVEALVATRIQSIRRGLVARRENREQRRRYALQHHLIRQFGIHTFEDLHFTWLSDQSKQRFGLRDFWWRKYFRDIPTHAQHWFGLAPTTTNDNVLVQAQQNPIMIAPPWMQVGNI